MQTILKVICWMTLFLDTVLILGSALTGVLGNGQPYARMRVGEFEVTSTMPGGGGFIIFMSLWTGVLAGSLLYSLKMNRVSNTPAEPKP